MWGFPGGPVAKTLHFQCRVQFSSVQPLSHVWLFDRHELQHARPPCPSLTPGVHPDSCLLRRHTSVSSSVIPFSSCPQSFPASGSFQMSQVFASGGQSIGVSASASVLPVNTRDCQVWSLVRELDPMCCNERSHMQQLKTWHRQNNIF